MLLEPLTLAKFTLWNKSITEHANMPVNLLSFDLSIYLSFFLPFSLSLFLPSFRP